MTASTSKIIRLGARGSLLSKMQSTMVARQLEAACPGTRVELVIVVTSGDRIQDRPLHELGGKGLFTKELEQALLRREIDFAVHSFKDVPVTMPLLDTADLVIAATPLREDPRDVVASVGGKKLADFKAGSRIGTGSLRRQAQVLELRKDVIVEPIRGNVDTRLKKLKAGEYDGVILAMAGLKRAGLFDPANMAAMNELLPAAGQGALALECRRDDANLRQLLRRLNDPATAIAVRAERALVQGLNGDCHSPIAAYAVVEGDRIILKAKVAARGGLLPVIRAQSAALVEDAGLAVEDVLRQLKSQGAMELLGT